MSRPRTRANPIPQEPDLANIVATLQRQLREQQQETNQLRDQVAQLNQIPQANEVPPQNNPVPPVAPQVPEVHQEVPLAPAGPQRNPPLIREDLLYERFRTGESPLCLFCIKEGCASLVEDGPDAQKCVQQDEFTSFKQGSMSVLEAVNKFEQLARLCPELVPNEKEKVRRMMKMFRTDIAKQISAGSSPPTLVADCISRAMRAEY
ncbi:hypothetical protein TIFTF001_048870 [Ficus carica]|uniref:Retrotransposon gag domain-containing protein n=1 Tax=Ficus carica TaxID=3494 RepID=A0AA88CLV2_FICCA|nr:hypothetical protein TIFTF001_048870 [Ficus carica]